MPLKKRYHYCLLFANKPIEDTTNQKIHFSSTGLVPYLVLNIYYILNNPIRIQYIMLHKGILFILFSISLVDFSFTNYKSTTTDKNEVWKLGSCTMDCIEGNVFLDQNINGENDLEPGIENIEVLIYDCNNNLIDSALTDANGHWERCSLLPNTDYRIEFILNAVQDSMYQNTIHGIDNGTNTQFAQINSVVDFGLSMKDPVLMLITPCYSFGGYQGAGKDIEALIGVPINETNNPLIDANTGLINYATHEEIGSTYGLAVDPHKNTAYVAAYMKRHSGFGPGGTGAIYEVDLTLANPPSVLADLNAIYGANTAGINVHDIAETDMCPAPNSPPTNNQCWFNDVDAWDAVGRTSLGDLDISTDLSTLYVMNLEDRSIYPIDINNAGIAQTPFPVPLDQDTDPNITLRPRDPAYDIRPFALKYHNDLLYVGLVDTEQSRDRDDICCSRGGGVIYIYSLDPSTGVWTLVLEEDIQRNGPGSPTPFFIHWHDNYEDNFMDGSHMLVADLEFDGEDLIVGLRDVSADKYGDRKGKPEVGDSTILNYQSVAGDVIRFCYDAPSGTYNFENNGSCGGITTSGAGNNFGWPENTTPRGSYYTGDRFSAAHPQTSFGSLWLDPNSERVYTTAFDITAVFQGGIRSLDNLTGLSTESYVLIPESGLNNGFGKVASLGDIESNSLFQPLEIGNLVWCDSIPNGIQDACESGIENIIVQIYDDAGLLVGQDTTDVNGHYYFNHTNVDSTGITVNASGVASPNTAWNNLTQNAKYYLVFGEGQYDNANQAFTANGTIYNGLASYNANGNTNDNIDSDVDPNNLSIALGSIPADLPQICINTDSIEYRIHDYDLGLVCPVFDLALTKTVNTNASDNPILVGSTVIFDLTIINQGTIDAFDIDIQDYFNPTELTFTNISIPSTSVQGENISVVGSGPNFELENLVAGDSVILQLQFTVSNGFAGTRIINNAEIIDASFEDNGPTAEDQDSPFSMINDGSSNELASDNDVDDEYTGGMDNPSDEDDYDPAQIEVSCQFNICLPVTFTRN